MENTKKMEQLAEDFITRGYKVKNRGERSMMMKKKTWGSATGHIVVGVLTIWWTLGLGNVVYAIYKRLTAEEVQIKIDDD